MTLPSSQMKLHYLFIVDNPRLRDRLSEAFVAKASRRVIQLTFDLLRGYSVGDTNNSKSKDDERALKDGCEARTRPALARDKEIH